MNIETKLREISEKALPDMSYVLGTLTEIDEKLDLMTPPFVWVVFPDMGTLTYRMGRWWESFRALVGFFDLTRRDADGEDNMMVYRRMVGKAKEWIKAYNESGYFEEIEGDIETAIHAEVGAGNVTGLMIDLVIRERDGRCG